MHILYIYIILYISYIIDRKYKKSINATKDTAKAPLMMAILLVKDGKMTS